jgi:hypothetical protein
MIKIINGQYDTHIHLTIKTRWDHHLPRMLIASAYPNSSEVCSEYYTVYKTPIHNHAAIAKQLADKLNWEIQSCGETEDGMVWLCFPKEEVNP